MLILKKETDEEKKLGQNDETHVLSRVMMP
jgi:hypothetical protein